MTAWLGHFTDPVETLHGLHHSRQHRLSDLREPGLDIGRTATAPERRVGLTQQAHVDLPISSEQDVPLGCPPTPVTPVMQPLSVLVRVLLHDGERDASVSAAALRFRPTSRLETATAPPRIWAAASASAVAAGSGRPGCDGDVEEGPPAVEEGPSAMPAGVAAGPRCRRAALPSGPGTVLADRLIARRQARSPSRRRGGCQRRGPLYYSGSSGLSLPTTTGARSPAGSLWFTVRAVRSRGIDPDKASPVGARIDADSPGDCSRLAPRRTQTSCRLFRHPGHTERTPDARYGALRACKSLVRVPL